MQTHAINNEIIYGENVSLPRDGFTKIHSGCMYLAALPKGKLGECKFEQRAGGESIFVAVVDDKRYVATSPFMEFVLEPNG